MSDLEKEILQYMNDQLLDGNFISHGEVECTKLAEDALVKFEAELEYPFEIEVLWNEDIYDLAVSAAMIYES